MRQFKQSKLKSNRKSHFAENTLADAAGGNQDGKCAQGNLALRAAVPVAPLGQDLPESFFFELEE